MNEFLEAAKKYLAAGLHPVPVEPRGKRPLVSWKKYQDQAPTLEELERWWAETPDANVALPMGRGVFALDIDGDEGRQALIDAGVLSLDGTMLSNGKPLDSVPTVSTGKGHHYYFRGEVSDRIGVLEKVDVRSSGGYVVAPPSVHASGRQYIWLNWTPGRTSFPPAPDSLLELIARPQRPTPVQGASNDWLVRSLAGVGEGERDVICTKIAGYLIGKGMPEAAVDSFLQVWNERNDPPMEADQVSKCVASIARRHVGDEPTGPPATIGDALDETLAELRLPPDERKIRPTELPGLDRVLGGGFSPGEMVLCGARPGVGKTALACQVARRSAKAGAGVLFVSREMTRKALVRRLLVQEAQVRAEALKTGNLTGTEWDMIAAASTRLRYLPMWLTQDILSTEQLDEALQQYEPGQLGLVVVDYLQLMRGSVETRDKRGLVEFVSQELKRFALKYNVPILVLSSLRRLAKRKDGSVEKPDMSDLRESGELEHDGDIVLIMTREFNSDLAELTIAKNRDGRVGTIKLRFIGELQKFEEVSA